MFIWEHKKFPMFAGYYIPDSFVNWTIEMLDLPKKVIVWEGWCDSKQLWLVDQYHYIIFYMWSATIPAKSGWDTWAVSRIPHLP